MFPFFGYFLMGVGGIVVGMSISEMVRGGSPGIGLVLGPALVLLGLAIAYAHYRLQIDPEQKTYREYVKVLGMKVGKPLSFRHIEKIYINEVKVNTTMNSYAGRRHDHQEVLYKAFMKMDTGEKIHLDSDKNEERLARRVDSYLVALKKVYHPTQSSPFQRGY